MSNEVDIERVLSQMRALAAQAEGNIAGAKGAEQSDKPDFAALLKDSVNTVNEFKKEAGELQEKFELGDPDTSLSEVMVAVQKASVSFEAMTQVRNKLVKAYKDIMSMPL